ncbi:hypothetical protein NP493_193g04078 [Ridgeia piscesae]|uniref:Uncharacterized protein n=1 Tax=Ridgeia piscesae TaxID=27915 RepID=A0AAD9UEV9_RIDPI|nr:hypothetical protein NP493_193g04078 [Ridgeia piscesae]
MVVVFDRRFAIGRLHLYNRRSDWNLNLSTVCSSRLPKHRVGNMRYNQNTRITRMLHRKLERAKLSRFITLHYTVSLSCRCHVKRPVQTQLLMSDSLFHGML